MNTTQTKTCTCEWMHKPWWDYVVVVSSGGFEMSLNATAEQLQAQVGEAVARFVRISQAQTITVQVTPA